MGEIADVSRLREYVNGAAEAQFLAGARLHLKQEQDDVLKLRNRLRDALVPTIENTESNNSDEKIEEGGDRSGLRYT